MCGRELHSPTVRSPSPTGDGIAREEGARVPQGNTGAVWRVSTTTAAVIAVSQVSAAQVSWGGDILTRVTVACDEPGQFSSVVEALTGIGCTVNTIHPDHVLGNASEHRPDVLILDLGNAESTRLRLCDTISTQARVPLILVGSDDRWLVPALSSGADDFVPMPLDVPVLAARVLALLRRCGYTNENSRLVRVRDLSVDLDRCQVMVAGRQANLTPIEYRILVALARRAGRVLSCAELLKEAQGYEADEQEARDIIKVHVYHLRRKIEPEDPMGGEYVVTVPGFGYMLERRTPSASAPGPRPGWSRRGIIREAAPNPASNTRAS
ncbi:MAG: response regulator transcription factor [Chloroflexi bacterium]|nr:response regulator transcription factor [Chloroflexota bacterium]MCL5107460.1 response regulator transcription factor [Chloroflexota bacterium]